MGIDFEFRLPKHFLTVGYISKGVLLLILLKFHDIFKREIKRTKAG